MARFSAEKEKKGVMYMTNFFIIVEFGGGLVLIEDERRPLRNRGTKMGSDSILMIMFGSDEACGF